MLEFKPLTLDKMALLSIGKNASEKEIAESSIKMIAFSLDVDEEAVKKMSFEFME